MIDMCHLPVTAVVRLVAEFVLLKETGNEIKTGIANLVVTGIFLELEMTENSRRKNRVIESVTETEISTKCETEIEIRISVVTEAAN